MKLLAITFWLMVLTILFWLTNGAMDSYVHFNEAQSAFTPGDFLSYFFFLLVGLIIFSALFVIIVKKVSLDPNQARIAYILITIFAVAWSLFSINLLIAYFIYDVKYPLGIMWYIFQIIFIGFIVYKIIKTPQDKLLNILK